MNKNILYIVIALIVGLLGGWLLFGNSSERSRPDKALSQPLDQEVKQWTCSMHPQIRQEASGDCPICGMDLVPVAATSNGLQPDQIQMTENAMALANIQTTSVGLGVDEQNSIQVSGTLEASQEDQVIQASYFKGRVEQLYVNFVGQQVEK